MAGISNRLPTLSTITVLRGQRTALDLQRSTPEVLPEQEKAQINKAVKASRW